MKIPERLIGFVDYENTKFPFEFDEENFTLNLYTPSIEVWNETSSIKNMFQRLEKDDKEHKWIGEIRLNGIASDGRKILFCLQDNRSNYHGFHSYPVNWYFYYSEQISVDALNGFSVEGEEIDYFFAPNQAIESALQFSKTKNNLEKITVTSNKQVTESCGKYRVIPHVDASIEVTCYATAHSNSYTNPIDATSKMIVSFSKPVDINTVVSAYNDTLCFLQYITYRTNISVNSTQVYYTNSNGLRDYQGVLVFKSSAEREEHKKKRDAIIPYHILRQRTGNIFTNIKNNKLPLQHLCKSIDCTRHYPSSRIIMIFAAFEREYRNIYGVDSERSDEYKSVKAEIVDLINEYTNSLSGKKRTYSRQLGKYVQNRDSSFEFNLKKALKECENIMSPFVRKKYRGTYNDAIDGLCERMGLVRNGIAHSRLDLQFDAVHLIDIKIVEELIYAIRFKKCHLKSDEIQKSINNIFRENIAL